jgi:hypothetical protein
MNCGGGGFGDYFSAVRNDTLAGSFAVNRAGAGPLRHLLRLIFLAGALVLAIVAVTGLGLALAYLLP